MKTVLSLLAVLAAGVAGLALVFTDLVPVPVGFERVAVGALLYVAAGYLVARWNADGRPLGWALATAWGLGLLGAVGLWITLTDPASGHLVLALTFLLGPALAALAGGVLGARGGARSEA